MEKCLKCDLLFETHRKMKIHYKENHSKIFGCLLCPKTFQNVDEIKHHLTLEHRGMSQEHLSRGTAAQQTKKQLGDMLDKNGNATPNFDCPECFEIFPTVDKLDDHRKKIHNMTLTDEARDKLKKILESHEKKAPQCEVCRRRFLGLVVCKMNGKPVGSCMNCYENHYGPNALARLTIGTPDEMIKKMKIPII